MQNVMATLRIQVAHSVG